MKVLSSGESIAKVFDREVEDNNNFFIILIIKIFFQTSYKYIEILQYSHKPR